MIPETATCERLPYECHRVGVPGVLVERIADPQTRMRPERGINAMAIPRTDAVGEDEDDSPDAQASGQRASGTDHLED